MGWFTKLFAKKPPVISTFELVRRIVGTEHCYVTDAESVDAARDYLPVVEALCKLTAGALHFDRVTCAEAEDDRVLTLGRGSRTWTQRLSKSSWIDHAVLDPLNEALGDKRLFAIHHRDWGQELCVVFATELVINELRVADYIIESDPPEDPPEQEHVLLADRVLHGHLFPAGTTVEYWIDPPYDAMEATLAAPYEVAGHVFPAGTQILFLDAGGLMCAVTEGSRIPFEQGAWQLDKAEPGY